MEREFRKQQKAGEDLEGRVRDNLQTAQQERMQQLQEAERRETAAEKVRLAAQEVEARLASISQEAAAGHRRSLGQGRGRRWGDDSEPEEEGGRERSQRGARAARPGGGAMEE